MLIAVLGVGCGGGDDDKEQPTSLSKAEYIQRADEVCGKTEKRQRKLLNQFTRENKSAGNSPEALEEAITFAALPPMEEEIEELSAIPLPDKEAAKAQEYLKALEKGVADTKREPGTLLAEPGAFTKAVEVSKDFGFKVCRGA